MINSNVFFLLGCPCAGKTTVANILAKKYDMFYFCGDSKRFDYYKYAEKETHPFMTMDASDFWNWTLDEMVAWEKGVVSEQTPYILKDLNELSKSNDLILFEGMLELATVRKMVPVNQIAYLSVDKSVCEREFFAREDHRGMIKTLWLPRVLVKVKSREEYACVRVQPSMHFMKMQKSLVYIHLCARRQKQRRKWRKR